MKKYLKAEELIKFLTSKIRTERSTIEIKKLIKLLEGYTVGERVTVEYPGWIDVKDRLPEKGQYVLIRQKYSLGEYEEITAGYYHVGEWRKERPYFYYAAMSDYGDMVRVKSICPGNEYVTHWMPMPKLPDEKVDVTDISVGSKEGE